MPKHTLAILQTVRFKGWVTLETVAAAVNISPPKVAERTEFLMAQGFLNGGKLIRITPEGRAKFLGLLAKERLGLDLSSVTDIYNDFHQLNYDFTKLQADWQVRNGTPSDHRDTFYDAEVLERLLKMHNDSQLFVDQLVAALPRLQPYANRFSSALERIVDGQHAYFLSPVIESYRTVWFELHKELIGILGHKWANEACTEKLE